MRVKYSKFAKIFAVVVLFVFIIPYFTRGVDKPALRSAVDLERQIDLEFKHQAVEPNDNNNNKNEGKREEQQPVVVGNDSGDVQTYFKDGIIGNYEPQNLPPRSGPGEGGVGVTLDASEQAAAQRLIGEFGFNMVASDKISLDRRIKDTRPAECKYWHYPAKLPTASVVIVFHNEGWSTLMRTVHSVINTSPPEMLADIVLVDDYSTKDHLKQHLIDYIKRFNGKVVLVRTEKREGLVQARVIGAQKGSGDVIIILDAHCECAVNWLPPLLARIKLNRKTLAIPFVDTINWDTLEHIGYGGDTRYVGIFEWGFLYKEMSISDEDFRKKKHASEPHAKALAIPIVDRVDWNNLEHRSVYRDGKLYAGIFEWGFLYKEMAVSEQTLSKRQHSTVPIVDGIDWNTIEHQDIYGGSLHRGIFEWGFLYKENEIPDREKARHSRGSEPYWSPTHAGGLLAIEKNWFFELGGYDDGIKIWGAEQYELSFKVWQCGGIVEWVPCSHVAHIYRGPRTESIHPPGGNPFQSAINHMRVAHTWMDEYAKYYFIRTPEISKLDYGDISAVKAVRDKLQCKPFKWYMENVAYDLVKKFPLPPDNKVWGEAVNSRNKICLDTRGVSDGQPIGVSGCHGQLGNQCRNTQHQVCLNQLGAQFGQKIGIYPCKSYNGQLFRLNVEGELSSSEHCFVSDKDIVKKKFCLDYQGIWTPVGEWKYDDIKKQIYSTKEKKCMSTDGQDLKLVECKDNDANQQWEWREKYY